MLRKVGTTCATLALLLGLTAQPGFAADDGVKRDGKPSQLPAQGLQGTPLPERVAGLVGIAAAPDFTERMWEEMTPAERGMLLETGLFQRPSDYSEEPYPITRRLIEDGRQNLVLQGPLHLPIPVRLLQGTADADVEHVGAQQGLHDVVLELAGATNHQLHADVDPGVNLADVPLKRDQGGYLGGVPAAECLGDPALH